VPAARTDTRLLLVAGVFAVLAGLLVAVLLLLATGQSETPEPAPLPIGPEESVRDQAPTYYADPFGGPGFWSAIEGGELVAISAELPGSGRCTVRYRATRDGFVDCDGNLVPVPELAQYPVNIPRSGDNEGIVLVDLRRRSQPPAS
jgi:hypothetical protein